MLMVLKLFVESVSPFIELRNHSNDQCYCAGLAIKPDSAFISLYFLIFHAIKICTYHAFLYTN